MPRDGPLLRRSVPEPTWDGVDWKALALACVAADLMGSAEAFAQRVFRACFVDGQPPRHERALLGLGAEVALSPDGLRETMQSSACADRHDENLRAALTAGAFGVPTFVLDDGQLFWGQDRLPLLQQALSDK